MRKIVPYLVLIALPILFQFSGAWGLKVFVYIQISFSFSLLLILLWLRKDQLEAYKIDRPTLLVLILFGSILHLRAKMPGEIYFQVFIGLCSAGIALFLLRHYRDIPGVRYPWLLISVLISIPFLLFQAYFWLLEGQSLQTVNSATFASETYHWLAFNLSYRTPFEEFLFRGVLTAYLVRSGWSEKKALWGQGIVFWLFHLTQLNTPFFFFITIPLNTFLYSYLAYKSRRLFPGIIAHTILNVFAWINFFAW